MAFQAAARLNPFFYMIDGFRYGMTGHAEGSLAARLLMLSAVNVILAVVCHRLIAVVGA